MKTLFSKIINPVYTSAWYTDLLLALPRIVGCYFLALNFGGSKFPCPDWFIQDVAKFGFPFPTFFAWAAVLAETFGGALLVIGLFTRVAGFMVMCTMLVAIFFQKWGGEVWEMLPAMGFLWISLYAIVMGSGYFGLDHLIAKKWLR
ncbi:MULTISPECIES: DoxX family protein [unclassified Arcicella]|uniref:DoxX family protein n=1 Tax=unclassified Arcicella TaxID=2644986 RepID=UPI00285708A6|nr:MULTISPECIES: DoxX family protein [unclassified Arcicella]MDR6560080.1 putative oxidoreductase [Arcicella sp. BE51]MDR6810313.1 putative oxidoreductase [Arcicella sp. BE140]MDR6821663.1 putative oxidoreductase [Arcicella sp. BE139]